MKLKLNNFEKLISSNEIFEKALNKTKEEYRPLDPGQYLYNLLLEKKKNLDIFSDEYLELVYTTLISWNMNGRGAKLCNITLFKESLRQNKEDILKLQKYAIEKLTLEEKEITLNTLKRLFEKLKLSETNSKLVSFSKTLHFLLPHLVVPIDRRYTISFFYNSKLIPTDNEPCKSNELQFKIFEELYAKFQEITKKFDLNPYLDNKWNANIPKIIDNAIIGFSKI